MRKLLPILALASALSLTARAQSTQEAISMQNAIEELSQMGPAANRTASFVSYHGDKDSTRGSRLLFDTWREGFVLGTYDTLLNNDHLFLNFDKISHVLYLTLDGKTFIKIETSQAKEIGFTYENKQTTLVRLDGIDPDGFFQPLSDSTGQNHYALYRLLTTRFIRANYQTNGLTSTGNNYDEYIDEYEYYLVMPGGKDYAPVKLKKKAIRDVLAGAGPKVEDWFHRHDKEEINEAFLVGLVNHLNN